MGFQKVVVAAAIVLLLAKDRTEEFFVSHLSCLASVLRDHFESIQAKLENLARFRSDLFRRPISLLKPKVRNILKVHIFTSLLFNGFVGNYTGLFLSVLHEQCWYVELTVTKDALASKTHRIASWIT